MKPINISILFFIHIILLLPIYVLGQVSQPENQNQWTLSQCVVRGMEQNLELKMGTNNMKKQRLSYEQGFWQFAPSISGGASSSKSFNLSDNQNNQSNTNNNFSVGYSVGAFMMLFDGFSRINQLSATKFSTMAYNEVLEQQKNQLYINILKAFTQAIFARQQVMVAEEQLAIAQKKQEEIELKVSVGRLGASEIDEVKATVSGNRLQLEKQKNAYTMNLLYLAQLIDAPPNSVNALSSTDFDLTIPSPTEYTTERVYALACENLPNLKVKELALRSQKKSFNATLGQLLPSISVSAGSSSQYDSADTLANGLKANVSEQFEKYLGTSASISLGFSIFNGRSTEFNIKRGKIDIENAVLALEQQKREVYNEIENAIQQLNASYLEYVNAVDNLGYAEKSFSIKSEKYSLGLINSTDFTTAQNQLLQAKTNVLAAKYSWIVQHKTIALLTGVREF